MTKRHVDNSHRTGERTYGIDTAAHRGALAVEGATVAVLPAGLDRPHPTGNQTLFDTIAGEGLLVSMWPPGAYPRRDRIAANRRLLAALSRGTILVEASLRSGALTTLREALALGRTAMVVPGPVTSAMSAGGHRALRDDPRIRLVTGLADVFTELDDVAAHPPA
jgi:DNA processing protein